MPFIRSAPQGKNGKKVKREPSPHHRIPTPKEKLQALETELLGLSPDKRNTARRLKIEDWLDSGIESCALSHLEVAKVMQETLLQFDGDRYHLIAWCVMPNHVHVLIETIAPMSKIVQS